MIKLERILCFLKSKLGCRIWGHYEGEFIIEDVGLLKKDMTYNAKTIYLVKEISNITREINVLAIVQQLDTSKNTLQIETSACIEEIYKEIRAFLLNNYKIHAKKSNLYSSLYKCGDINEMLNICEDYLNNPIYILDTSYRILYRSKMADSIKDYIQQENGKTYLLMDTINMMKKDKCIDDIYNSNKAFFKLADCNLIFCGIHINSITVSYICVIEEHRKFSQDDLELVDAISEVITFQIHKDDLFINRSGLEEEYYLMDLLMSEITNSYYIEQRLENIDFKINMNLWLIVIPFSQSFQSYRHNFALKQLISMAKNILGNCIGAYYEDRIILMVSSKSNSAISNNVKVEFTEFLKLNNLKASVSSIFFNILETKNSYLQAIYTIGLSEHLNDEGVIFYFDNYLEYYLFSISENSEDNIKKIELDKLIHPAVKKLIDIDKDSKGELLKTLMIYLESNRNSNIASKKLNIHCSTFFYRFHKIENLLDISLNDCDILFKIEFSLKILRYKNLI